MGSGGAVLSGSVMIPKELVDVAAVKKQLTISYAPLGAEEPLELLVYTETQKHIFVPRQYGLDLCKRLGISVEDQTSPGTQVKFPKVPKPRDYQVATLDELEDTAGAYYDFIFRARTGWGKTVGMLSIAARIGVSTLVVVDQENLKDQWIATLVERFGFRAEDIGIIQGPKCIYEGKAVTIAMVQTLSQRTYPPEVYEAFGLMLVDEVHIIGAPTFSTILLDFAATIRIGASATPKRRDGLQKVLTWSLGEVRVRVEDEHEASAVYVAEHPTIYSEYANKAKKMGRFISEVSEDGSRNLLLAEAAAYLSDTGRATLVLSDRIEQLRDLESLCYYLGMPASEIGLYTGYYPAYGYEKDPTPSRRPPYLAKHPGDKNTEPGYYYTPVCLKLISKRLNKKTLEKVKTTASIVYATYGKFAKGVDEPRLCAGVDATPRSTAEQVQGRILRKMDGKLRPIWVTVVDTNSYRSINAFLRRFDEYVKNNSILCRWSLDTGKQPCNANDLLDEMDDLFRKKKSMQIATNRDGLNIMLTRKEQVLRVMRQGTGTARRAPNRRAG